MTVLDYRMPTIDNLLVLTALVAVSIVYSLYVGLRASRVNEQDGKDE